MEFRRSREVIEVRSQFIPRKGLLYWAQRYEIYVENRQSDQELWEKKSGNVVKNDSAVIITKSHNRQDAVGMVVTKEKRNVLKENGDQEASNIKMKEARLPRQQYTGTIAETQKSFEFAKWEVRKWKGNGHSHLKWAESKHLNLAA